MSNYSGNTDSGIVHTASVAVAGLLAGGSSPEEGGPAHLRDGYAGSQEKRRPKAGIYALCASAAFHLFSYSMHGGVMQFDAIVKSLASDPARLFDHLPMLILAYLLYTMNRDNERNFREVIRVVEQVGQRLGENTAALEMAREREEREEEHERDRHAPRRAKHGD